uniref:Uncharacterized protein n=1 Tax=Chenopodium quinoa TaxID=63459 RepID=A0A803LZ16_CHEQI
EANTIQESQERAAQKAVQKLMSHFEVRVGDFTADRLRMYQLCKFLGAVVRKTGVCVSSLEHVFVEGLGYVAWVTVTCLHCGSAMECVHSNPFPEPAAAMQKAAKKKCSALKEKFYQLKECLATRGDPFIEDEYYTPKAEIFRIPNSDVPPVTHVKRRSSALMEGASSFGVRITEPLVSGIPVLETVKKRAKFI